VVVQRLSQRGGFSESPHSPSSFPTQVNLSELVRHVKSFPTTGRRALGASWIVLEGGLDHHPPRRVVFGVSHTP